MPLSRPRALATVSALSALPVMLATPLLAAPVWIAGASSTPNLNPRFGHAMVYDSGRQRVVLFGGFDGVPLGDTWEYDGAAWSPEAVGPPGRAFHAMAYDAARQSTVLFGGSDDPGSYFGDTWEYDGASWVEDTRSLPGGLTPREFATMAFDAARARVVMFGGSDGAPNNETWEYDANGWVGGAQAPQELLPRSAAAMAYDSARQVIVMFGGSDGGSAEYGDTWEYSGGGWTPANVAGTGPAARAAHAMAFDSVEGRTVVFGGGTSSGANLDDTWEFDGTQWHRGAPTPSGLEARALSGMAYDAARGEAVLYGGAEASGNLGDTWLYRDTGVDFVVGQGLGPTNPNRVRLFTAQGTPTTTDFYAYGATSWGVNVAASDTDADPLDELVTGPGPGPIFGPQARGFTETGAPISQINFFAYGTLKYGLNVELARVDGDTFAEILTGAGPGGVFGPHVRGWNHDGGSVRPISKISFFAFGTLKYGVNVAGGRLDNDGYAEIAAGAGPGGIFGSQVRGFDYDDTAIASIPGVNFLAFPGASYGVNIAVGDVDVDLLAEFACAHGPGPGLDATFAGFNYDGVGLSALPGYLVSPFGATYFGGRVGLSDVARDGAEDLLAGAGRDLGASSLVKAFSYSSSALTELPVSFVPFGGGYGVNPTGGLLGF